MAQEPGRLVSIGRAAPHLPFVPGLSWRSFPLRAQIAPKLGTAHPGRDQETGSCSPALDANEGAGSVRGGGKGQVDLVAADFGHQAR